MFTAINDHPRKENESKNPQWGQNLFCCRSNRIPGKAHLGRPCCDSSLLKPLGVILEGGKWGK